MLPKKNMYKNDIHNINNYTNTNTTTQCTTIDALTTVLGMFSFLFICQYNKRNQSLNNNGS